MKPKMAIVCDWLVSRGGAERVILAMAEMFQGAPIYTTIFNEKKLPEFQGRKIVTSFLQNMPFAKVKHALYLPLMPYAVEQFDLSEFDIVISSSHSCAKGIITKPETLHTCYCLTPTRYLWVIDPSQNYHHFGQLEPLASPLKRPLLSFLRLWDQVAKTRPDAYISISSLVQNRVKRIYGYDSKIVKDDAVFRPESKGLPKKAFGLIDFPSLISHQTKTRIREIGVWL